MIRYCVITLPFLCLTACDGGMDGSGLTEAEAQQGSAAKMECALAGAEEFSRDCSTDRISGPDRELLVIHHPDGGFQRFEIVTDGRGLVAADGFDDTEIRLLEGDMIEVTSGEDRYRLPARIQAGLAEQNRLASGQVGTPSSDQTAE